MVKRLSLTGYVTCNVETGVNREVNFPNPFYRWRPHPWHGLEVGENPPEVVNAAIADYEEMFGD